MRALVVAAHPDDEVLGCGGTIARLAAEGHRVWVAFLADGVAGRYEKPADVDPDALRVRHAQWRAAAGDLGVEDVLLCGFPDQRLDTVPLLEVTRALEELIARLRPEVVYTHHAGDLNADHAIAHRATLTATRPVSGCPVREVYAYEVASATEWAFGQAGPAFQPNVFVDIGATLERKLAALARYRDEARAFPHPRSPEVVRASAVRWGSVAGVAAAEPFVLVRGLR